MELKIAICDDEKYQTEYLTALATQWAEINDIKITADIFDSAESFLSARSDGNLYHIALLDIQMGGKNGIELAREIRLTDAKTAIVFITGVPDFISDGYDVSALHYLMKPVNEAKLFEILTKAYGEVAAGKNLDTAEKYIIVNVDGVSGRINQSRIVYIEAFAHTCEIHTVNKTYEVKKSISEFEKVLDEKAFIFCHRSYIVNLKYVNSITKTDVILDGGKTVPVSRRMYNQVNQAFIQYFRGE